MQYCKGNLPHTNNTTLINFPREHTNTSGRGRVAVTGVQFHATAMPTTTKENRVKYLSKTNSTLQTRKLSDLDTKDLMSIQLIV